MYIYNQSFVDAFIFSNTCIALPKMIYGIDRTILPVHLLEGFFSIHTLQYLLRRYL